MIELEKATTLYSQDQDRVSINATIRGGGTARIWLTQRIVHRLVHALVKIVKPQHDDPIYAEVIASVAQQKAVDRHEPQAPVKADAPEHEWLVSKIDLQIPQSGVVVMLYSAAGQSARLSMSAELLRQWLSILRRVYEITEWRGAEWPDWVVGPSASEAETRILH